jgi:hypothetical protein
VNLRIQWESGRPRCLKIDLFSGDGVLGAIGIPTLHALEQNWQETGEWINDPIGY